MLLQCCVRSIIPDETWCGCVGLKLLSNFPIKKGFLLSLGLALVPVMDETRTDLGSPSVSRTRRSLSIICCVGPPPPSPKPNRAALWLALPLSLLFFTVLTSCGPKRTQHIKKLFTLPHPPPDSTLGVRNSHLQLSLSFRRNFQVGSELKPWNHRYLPRKMCCALKKIKVVNQNWSINLSTCL